MSTDLTIDWTRCEARGLCLELLPEILVEDDWGYPESRDHDSSLPVPPGVIRFAEQAVRDCPRLALRLTKR